MSALFDPPPEAIYRPFAPGPYRMAMELQALRPDERFERDTRSVAQIALRQRLMRTRRAEVLMAAPGTEAACRETLAAVRASVADARVCDTEGSPALAIAGGLVAEDLLLLADEPDGPRLVAGALCFPTRWRLADKIGRKLVDVHGPVPGFAAHLANPVSRVIARLQPDRAVGRLTWSLMDDAALFQPVARPPRRVITAENAGRAVVLRVERQTLSRLPRSGVVLFTIRVHVYPLGRAIDTAARASTLAATLRALPDAMARYKGLLDFRAPLLAWLDQRASA